MLKLSLQQTRTAHKHHVLGYSYLRDRAWGVDFRCMANMSKPQQTEVKAGTVAAAD